MKLEVTRWGMDGFDLAECDDGDYVPFDEIEPAVSVLEATLAARDAEIERLKAELALRKDYADQVRAQDTTITRLGVEIAAVDRRLADALALVEKRERQLVWAMRHGAEFNTDIGARIWWFRLVQETDGDVCVGVKDTSDAGLLAAIDEATAEKTR